MHKAFSVILFLLVPFTMAVSCMAAANTAEEATTNKGISKRSFGKTKAGESVEEYTLTNAHGMKACIITYGATLRELCVPDASKKCENIILGFDNLAQYEESKNRHYFGATIGRYANRIAGGKFKLDGKEFKLALNNGPNTLHGGNKGFDRVCWKATPLSPSANPALRFDYVSEDMEEGYPGKVSVSVTYTLTDDDALKLDYVASTDKATPINLTNHVYFNLDGAGNGTILKHKLKILSDEYLPVDKVLIPLGKAAKVKGTPFDFTSAKEIGADLASVPGGYDHNWNLRYQNGKLIEALSAYAADSGRVLHMFTTEPGVQIYIGQGQDGTLKGLGGNYQKYCGFTLEAQHYPDSPNRPEYPNVILQPGKQYKQSTIYRFTAK